VDLTFGRLIVAAAKKHAGMPLYLRVTAYHIAHFCEYRTFQREPQKKKQELLEHVCSQLPGELDYLIEDRVITLLECQYGQVELSEFSLLLSKAFTIELIFKTCSRSLYGACSNIFITKSVG
jgi:hypothetical protein